MSLSLEQLIVALLAIVPGFLSASIRARYEPRSQAMSLAWLGICLLRSLAFHAVVLVPTALAVPAILDYRPLQGSDASMLPPMVPIGALIGHAIAVYVVAYLWGHAPVVPVLRSVHASLRAGGAIDPENSVFRESLESMLNRDLEDPLSPLLTRPLDAVRSRLRSIIPDAARSRASRVASVFGSAFGPLRIPNTEHAHWLVLRRGEGRIIYGRVAKASPSIAAEHPFELLLSPANEVELDERVAREFDEEGVRPIGVYLRVEPGDEISFYRAPVNWTPPAFRSKADAGED